MKSVKILIIRARHDPAVVPIPDAACQEAITTGSGSLFGYWSATSQQHFDFTGSRMLPWVDITVGADDSRTAVAQLAIAAARDLLQSDPVQGMDGILVLPFPGQRQIQNPNPEAGGPPTITRGFDGGATSVMGLGTAVVPVNTGDFTFLCHELGHVLGFGHSFGLLNNGSDWNGLEAPIVEANEYGSPYDLMSSATFGGRWQGSPPHYNATPTFQLPSIVDWTGSRRAGPNLSRAMLDFEEPDAMLGSVVHRSFPTTGSRVYERVWAPDQSGRPRLLAIQPAERDTEGARRIYVEYRPARGWDAGLGQSGPELDRAGAVVHTVTDVPNVGPRVWYRGSVPTGSIDRDLAVETTGLVVGVAYEDPDGNFADIEVTVGARAWVEIRTFDYRVRDRGGELPERTQRTQCLDLVTVRGMNTVTTASYRATATGLGGAGRPGPAVVLAWSVDGVPLTAREGQVAVRGSMQPLHYRIANDVLTLASSAGERVSAAGATVRATATDGTASATGSAQFAAYGVRTWMSDEDAAKAAACKAKFERWLLLRVPWLKVPMPDPPPLEKLENPAVQLESWKSSVRAQFEHLPNLTEAESAAIAQVLELDVAAMNVGVR